MKTRVALSVFRSFVLPKLKAEHTDPAALQAAIDKDYEVVDTNATTGKEEIVQIDVKALDAPKPQANANADADDDKIQAMVKKLVADAAGNIVARGGDIRVGKDRAEYDPKAGFKTFGEYSQAVKNFAIGAGNVETDTKLRRIKAPTVYANEGVGADGGFLVPLDFSREVLRLATSEQSLLPLTRQITVAGNQITMPIDESTAWSGNGVTANWTGEGQPKPESKPGFGETTMTLHKLTVLVPVTDELLQDSFISLGAYIAQLAAERIMDKVNMAIIAGTGAGQPLGYRNHAAYKVVAKTAGQTADTLTVANLAQMFSGINPASVQRGIFLYNPSIFGQLVASTIGNMPVWTPSIAGAPGGTIFGRPAIASQYMNVLGDQGDIEFVDLSQYITITKGTGIEQAVSIHLYFDRDITTFRFVLRVGGRPWMTSPVTGRDGISTYSPFVALGERA